MDGKPPTNEAHGGSPSLNRLASSSPTTGEVPLGDSSSLNGLASSSSLAGSAAANPSSSTESVRQDVVEHVSHGQSVVAAYANTSLVAAEISPAQTRDEGPPIPFIPSLGAWAKPLSISMPSNLLDEESNQAISPTNWPSLAASQGKSLKNGANRGKAPAGAKPLLTKEFYPPAVKEDGSLRFPWAAKMIPSMRNLYRTTTPTYLEDGTPKVNIPSHLLLHGPENQREYIIGQFYRCSTPSGGLVNAVVNRIWGRKCKIFTRKLGESSFLFHIPDESTRSWILQRGLWHVDGCLLFVATWSPAATMSLPEISTVPVWVTLRNIPDRLYSRPGISRIASGLGEPITTFKPRLDPTLMGEAKIMVEVELDKPFPQKIVLDDKKGTISIVDVEYSWIPSKCERCGHLGHKESRCLLRNLDSCVQASSPITASVSGPVTVDVSAPVTVDGSAPVTVDVSPPVTVDVSPPVTVDVSAPITVDVFAPVIVDVSAPVTGSTAASAPVAAASAPVTSSVAIATIIEATTTVTEQAISENVDLLVSDAIVSAAPTTSPSTYHETSPAITVNETESTVPIMDNDNLLLGNSP